jgi:hypothetical protein
MISVERERERGGLNKWWLLQPAMAISKPEDQTEN